MSIVQQLPVEITREIFSYILLQHGHDACRYTSNTRHLRYGEDGHCTCWQIDMLNVAMVCQSWYLISMETMQSHQATFLLPWPSLLNYASHQRNFPFRSKLIQLLQESQKMNVALAQHVRHLMIDFASFDTIKPEKLRLTWIKKKVHHASALDDVLQLIQLANTQRLDIVCDAAFASLVDTNNNRILSTSLMLEKALLKTFTRIRRLDFIGYNPIQRCPCCASKDWDMYLYPIIRSVSLDTVVLHNVLPSSHLFDILASTQPNLKRIVFYKSMITVPKKKSEGFLTSISQIPKALWHQVNCVEIYEDIEDATTWRIKRYLNEFVEHIGPQLQEFVLQFGTKEENQKAMDQPSHHSTDIRDPNSPLHELKAKCKESLKCTLVNVPNI
ncbi:hypothetical protein CU098_002996 [Rhizopus stolonifer]|uniref:F-box domain-containing protein n=1 Tax=Rhizopus stolonifer TaxID=4846 RepID=A0A367J1S6_RHIST|nr:hypothetical protein CU098_002996 [Rhizopus stolonifer]